MAAPVFSIEFYPPRNPEQKARLDVAHGELARLKPDFFSVTYGAGGSTRAGTRQVVLEYKALGSTMAPHLSFGGGSEREVRELLADYRGAGIGRLVALRGDLPSGAGAGVQHRYASELIEFVRAETGDHFHIEVACYPEIHPDSPGYDADVRYFRDKVRAGADSAITQYFFNADAYFRFVDFCDREGIRIPIVPGIMPITNYARLARFSAGCGAEIPRWLAARLRDFGDDTSGLREFGIEVVTSLCERLLAGGAPGLHFYSLNVATATTRIWNNLALGERR